MIDYGALVLAAAKSHIGVKEATPNWGEQIQLYLAKVGLKDAQPWCAAFVAWTGWYALLDPATGKSAWPAPLTAGCKALGEWAAKKNVLTETGAPGQFYLLLYPSMGRFAHTGWVVAPTGVPNQWWVIDGNSNDNGSREGYAVVLRKRTIDTSKGHRFVDWQSLMPKEDA